MTQRTNNASQTNPTTFATCQFFNPDLFLSWTRPMLEAFAEMVGRSIEKSSAMNAAWASLAHNRFAEAIDLQNRLAACRSPEDAFRAYAMWSQIAVEQYQASFDEMMRIGRDIQRETAVAVSDTFNGTRYPSERRAA